MCARMPRPMAGREQSLPLGAASVRSVAIPVESLAQTGRRLPSVRAARTRRGARRERGRRACAAATRVRARRREAAPACQRQGGSACRPDGRRRGCVHAASDGPRDGTERAGDPSRSRSRGRVAAPLSRKRSPQRRARLAAAVPARRARGAARRGRSSRQHPRACESDRARRDARAGRLRHERVVPPYRHDPVKTSAAIPLSIGSRGRHLAAFPPFSRWAAIWEPLPAHVVGLHVHGTWELAKNLARTATPLRLERDLANEHDPQAVACYQSVQSARRRRPSGCLPGRVSIRWAWFTRWFAARRRRRRIEPSHP